MSDDDGLRKDRAFGGRFDSPYLRPTRDQLLTLVLLSPLLIGFGGTAVLSSGLSGALCAVLPQAYFGWRMTRAARRSAAQAARQGLAAEGGKFLLSAAGFAVVFAVVKPPFPGLVFAGFGALWLVQVISTARQAARPQSV